MSGFKALDMLNIANTVGIVALAAYHYNSVSALQAQIDTLNKNVSLLVIEVDKQNKLKPSKDEIGQAIKSEMNMLERKVMAQLKKSIKSSDPLAEDIKEVAHEVDNLIDFLTTNHDYNQSKPKKTSKKPAKKKVETKVRFEEEEEGEEYEEEPETTREEEYDEQEEQLRTHIAAAIAAKNKKNKTGRR